MNKGFASLATPELESSIAPGVIARVRFRQRAAQLRPWLLFLAAVVGVFLSLPSIAAFADVGLLSDAFAGLTQGISGLLSQLDPAAWRDTLNPVLNVVLILVLLGGFAVLSEA